MPKKVGPPVKRPSDAGRELSRDKSWSEPLVVKLAEETWRLVQRLDRAEAAGQIDDASLRALRDSAKRMNDALLEREVETVVHTGEQFDLGMQLEVLDSRGDGPDLIVIETIRPTIHHQRRVLRHGQVVIGPKTDLDTQA